MADVKNFHKKYEMATFAGGCFWCAESAFQGLPGVADLVVGYMGDSGERVEVVQILFDPAIVSYESLLNIFWRQIDPTDAGGQFADRGPGYQTIIFCHSQMQQLAAERSKQELDLSGRFDKPIVTAIKRSSQFEPAEVQHQGYAKKNPLQYRWYRFRSGRDDFLKKVWKKS